MTEKAFVPSALTIDAQEAPKRYATRSQKRLEQQRLEDAAVRV
jgi:hypothetical protein